MEAANAKSDLVEAMKSALLEGGIAMRNMLDPLAATQQKSRVEAQNQRYAQARDTLLKLPLTQAEKSTVDEIAT